MVRHVAGQFNESKRIMNSIITTVNTVSAARITQLLAIGQLAAELHGLKSAARHAKDAYHDKLDKSNMEFDGLDPRNPDFAEAIEFTKTEYKAHQSAKRKVYNMQRRLDSACRKFGEVSA